jgi:photosystem II stability/assembly factor-like uncharacterized protein
MKKTSLTFALLVLVLVSCSSPQPESTAAATAVSLPDSAAPKTPTVVPTPAIPLTREPTALPTQPLPALQEAHFVGMDMMDESSGWAWAVDRASINYWLHTSDGGQTWKNVTPQENLQMYSYGYSDYKLDAQTAWMLLGGQTLVRTVDGGQTWDVMNRNFHDELVWPYPDWYTLHFEDAEHGWLRGDITAAGARVLFYETRDGGLNWDPADMESLPEGYRHQNAMNEIAFWVQTSFIYYDLERLIITPAEQEGVLEMFLSIDRGSSWKTVQLSPSPDQPLNPYNRSIHPPVFFDSQNGVLTANTWNEDANASQVWIYGTSDGGQTWSLLGGPAMIEGTHIEHGSEIKFFSAREAVLLCETALCVTHDSGNSWQRSEFGVTLPTGAETTYFRIDFIDPNTGWLLIDMYDGMGLSLGVRLLKTNDGGVTWTEISPVVNS